MEFSLKRASEILPLKGSSFYFISVDKCSHLNAIIIHYCSVHLEI